jgi:hypothetical protein
MAAKEPPGLQLLDLPDVLLGVILDMMENGLPCTLKQVPEVATSPPRLLTAC